MTSHSVKERLRPLGIFFVAAFMMHLLWENLQAPLYEGFTSFQQHFWICFKAAWGDLLFMLAIYAALAALHRDLFWIADRSTYAHPATWIIAVLVGILLAVSFEYWAVNVDHRWEYTAAMPLLPFLHIGITPVLQMMVIPLGTLLISYRFSLRT